MMKRILFLILGCYLLPIRSEAQKAYFVDGYHGGIYGHYPLWVTQFMVDNLAKHPEWKLGLEIEPETWDSVRVQSPVDYANFSRIALDNRIEFTNPTYAQPYAYNISGESLIRQFEYGIKRLHEHFPGLTFSTYAVEEPCFTSSLPQLLKQFGFKYAVLKSPNTCWGGYTRAYGGQLVNWIGPEGSSILTVPRYKSEALEEKSTWQTTAWNNSTTFLQSSYASGINDPVGMCYQDAGWKNGPWLGYGDNIKNQSTYVTWKEYFEEISAGKTDDNWRFSQEDVLVNLMWGSQALQRIGQQVRNAENMIVRSEKISAMANIDHQYKPTEDMFFDAWRTLMMAQHHDSWIVPYNQLNTKQNWIQAIKGWTDHTHAIAGQIADQAINGFATVTKTGASGLGFIRVYNSIASARSEVISLPLPDSLASDNIDIYNSKGELVLSTMRLQDTVPVVTFQATVPAMGYATYQIRKSKTKQKNGKHVIFDYNGNCVLENDQYKMVLDKSKGGIIKTLIAKHVDDKDFAGQDKIYDMGEISGFFYEDQQFYSSKQTPVSIVVLEDNGLVTKVEVRGTIATHPFSQIITLEAGQNRIDFDLTIDWKNNVGIGEYKQGSNWTDNRRAYTDDRYKLKVMFPNSLGKTKLFKNAPFDVCESILDNTFFGQWDSIKHNVILNWVDINQQDEAYGLALLSDHTTSYLHGENYPLSLTVQYSGIGLWGMDYKINGPTKMKYALIPHRGKWDDAQVASQSTYWNEPLVAMYQPAVALQDHSFVKISGSGYEVTTMKVVDGDILLRLFNAEADASPKMIALGFPATAVTEVLLNGDQVQDLSLTKIGLEQTFTVQLPRYGIKTLRITK
ncbi:glycoside hydrolase family 38 C-terminal domain-containing protein [Sphingobacterium sp. SG20118]|uniref:glycoside hydrolase family 38 C-terminal domain-containing protein n=1 Tax=Sphingobacterium sp. SG20118 TaxID=3367156 RepID=UPI0037DFBEA3